MADLAHNGILTRGLRAILAHHILVAWNRAGIPASHQAVWPTAAPMPFPTEDLRNGA